MVKNNFVIARLICDDSEAKQYLFLHSKNASFLLPVATSRIISHIKFKKISGAGINKKKCSCYQWFFLLQPIVFGHIVLYICVLDQQSIDAWDIVQVAEIYSVKATPSASN